MNYNTIGFMVTNQCNAKCKMCCIDDDECLELSAKEIKRFLLGVENDNQIQNICFSGGEVLLPSQREKLFELISYSSQLNKRVSIVTNAFWGKNYIEAKKIIKRLKSTGLDALTISCDIFHQEYVSVESVANVYNLCKEFDIEVEVQAIILHGEKIINEIDILNNMTGGIKVNVSACYPVGCAKVNYIDSIFIRNQEPIHRFCRKGGSFSVNSDGSIWPCCSPMVTETKLCIGNIKEGITYKIALTRMENNNILKNMRRYGFDYFRKSKIWDNTDIPDKVISSCELCSLLFTKYNQK